MAESGVTLPSGWRVRLLQAIRESGKKQAAVAREAGRPLRVSSASSPQNARPSFESIARIARAAGVSLGWIMEEPGFTLTDEQRAKVRTAGVLLLNLKAGCRSERGAGPTLKSGSETSSSSRSQVEV